MNWYLENLRKYATFSGRARRKEYWMYFLVNALIIVALGYLSDAFDLKVLGVLKTIYVIATAIPAIAVAVRRLHDVGKSGIYILVYALIPIAGIFLLLYFLVKEGDPADNQYGANPKLSV